MFDTSEGARGLSSYLEKKGIIVPYMNYPVRQDKFLLRIALSADHTDEQISQLLDNITKWKDKNGTN
ncbi:MAG: hypothetical protein IPJ37_24525 [Bacteroidales bacterium]|nr:hypothetical protein [Bacteroidales bacterium]